MAGHVRRREIEAGTRYYPVLDIDGRRRTFGSYTTKRDAEARLRVVRRKVADGTIDEERPITFAEFYARWFNAKGKSLKPSTRISYEQAFRDHILPYLGKKRLRDLKPRDIQVWIGELGEKNVGTKEEKRYLSPASISRCYRYLRACLKQAEAWEDIDKCPCRSIDLPREAKEEISFLEPGEIMLLLDSADEPERTLFATLALSGLRLGEGLGLAWRHVNFQDNAIIVERAWSPTGGLQEPKTASSRRAVPLMPALADILREHYQRQGSPGPDALLFSFSGSRPLDHGNVRREFYRANEAAGLKRVTIHSLRHSYASLMLACGASIKALQCALGHASATMTLNTYSHLIQEDLAGSLLRANAVVTGEGGKVIQLEKRVEQ